MKTEVIKTQPVWVEKNIYEQHPTYPIISPVHNEEAVLTRLYERIRSVINSTKEWWELILVNDGSSDSSYQIITTLSQADIRVKGINLSRHFGFQAAVTAEIIQPFFPFLWSGNHTVGRLKTPVRY